MRKILEKVCRFGYDSDGDISFTIAGIVSFTAYKGGTIVTRGNAITTPAPRYF